MLERFTEQARAVLTRAEESAAKRTRPRGGRSPVMTVDLLYALCQADASSITARMLQAANISQARLDELRTGLPTEHAQENAEYSDISKQVLELSLREALSLGHNYIGTEHLLLALTRVVNSSSGTVLAQWGIDFDAMRSEIVRLAHAERAPVKEEKVKSAEEALAEAPSRNALAEKARRKIDEIRDPVVGGPHELRAGEDRAHAGAGRAHTHTPLRIHRRDRARDAR
jgi:ATP-dependent Clp protease ATP-binding subunit ClpC